jgi:hypothetical protein
MRRAYLVVEGHGDAQAAFAVVLAHREFEAFFLPCLPRMAGRKLISPEGVERPGLVPGSVFKGDPQSIRGVKEWLSKRMPAGRAYKPTLDQLALARMVDFQMLRACDPPLPCYGSLERAIRFLHRQPRPGRAGVYPAREARTCSLSAPNPSLTTSS